MSGGSSLIRVPYKLVNDFSDSVLTGAVDYLMGKGDGSGGWSPLQTIYLSRCYLAGNVTGAAASTDLELVVYVNGVTTGSDDVFRIVQDVSSTGWFDSYDTTENNASRIVTPSDSIIVKRFLTTGTTCTVASVSAFLEAYAIPW